MNRNLGYTLGGYQDALGVGRTQHIDAGRS